jgi:hypothetical protein
MATRQSRVAPALVVGLAAFWAMGCTPARPTPVEEAEQPAAPAVDSEYRQVAEAALGKQAEIVARGDLAGAGSEQLLVVNRVKSATQAEAGAGNSTDMHVTRAVIVEKRDGKWSEVLRCDERLKNPRGYLGGAPAGRVTGWRLLVNRDANHGLELQFAPATPSEVSASSKPEGGSEAGGRPILVRWNTNAKRYQSLDQSHKGFLGEVPTLDTPQSILK